MLDTKGERVTTTGKPAGRNWSRFGNWPLRAKLALLLVVASLVPLGTAALFEVRAARLQLVSTAEALLAARGDQLVDQLDTLNRGYERTVESLARLPDALALGSAEPETRELLAARLLPVLGVQLAGDPSVAGVAILDDSGTARVATDPGMIGRDLSRLSYVKLALRGSSVISDIQVAGTDLGGKAIVAYVAPIRRPGHSLAGLVVLWIRATAIWDVMKASNELAGAGSFAVLFDHSGIRVGHTYSDDIVFHPGGQLPRETIDAAVAERRFGEPTRALLEEIRSFPEQFDRSRADSTDRAAFRGYAPANQRWNFGVARRFQTVPWTLFYMVPEQTITAQVAALTREKLLLAAAIMLAAITVGAVLASFLLRPIQALTTATQAFARGDLDARVATPTGDEIGRSASSFNVMAERIASQAAALTRARDDLEVRVERRTSELAETARRLELEVEDRGIAQQKLAAQLARMDLLQQITRAVGERQDLQSIFQVVIRSVEDELPVDFCCICKYDQPAHALLVAAVGVRSSALAMDLAMPERARVAIDENGLSRCVRGQLVYEPTLEDIHMPFPDRLSKGGLRALVIAPLMVESQVFGVLVSARREAESFSSGECEFLRQLSEHVGLAAHHAQLYGALQQAYDDLRQTQQAVMQQERLRALGEMASGIAHDINNAISPVALYTESLLETEPGLSKRARDYLATIQRAIEDVAQTVARMREFYRKRETQLDLQPVDLRQLIQQVVDLTRARWSDMPLQRGVVVRLETEVALELPAVLGIESEIREALINLIFNAVDAMPHGGKLKLRGRVAETSGAAEGSGALQHVAVEVVDDGVGMDDDTRGRCIEPFFTTKGERGTGLGLAMVYGVAKRHRAELEVESKQGVGTTMRLIFPVPEISVGQSTTLPPEHAPPARLRILVVDDDPLVLKSLQDALEAEGHLVTAVGDGQGGIDTFRRAHERGERFSIVITDLGMPHVDGRKVARVLKETSPETPVILLTGWGQRLVAEGEVPPHVDRILNKPPKLRELRAAFAQLVKRPGS